jgi:hypothetical protein
VVLDGVSDVRNESAVEKVIYGGEWGCECDAIGVSTKDVVCAVTCRANHELGPGATRVNVCNRIPTTIPTIWV